MDVLYWADGRFGDYTNSRVVINDSRLIDDLFEYKILGKYKLLEKMQELADQDAKVLKQRLDQAAISKPQKIIVLTHIPPFKEACLHNGEISNDDWLPFFSSKVVGDLLTNFAIENNKIALLVLCGHTHSEAIYQPLPNLVVRAGKSEYYLPQILDVIDI
jgi:Icc-related predicted phosphoesterase